MFQSVTINDSSVTFYNCQKNNVPRGTISDNSKTNLTKAYKSPCLTKKSKKKIKKILFYWVDAVEQSQALFKARKQRKRRYISMVTLTLPATQYESDEVIKSKYLNNFLVQLKRKVLDINYLWVAEKQKNGNIHFHLIVDRWVDKFWLQKKWNEVLDNGHYISTFANKYGHTNPPSTHVTGSKDMKNVSAYLAGYINKSPENIVIGGKLWDCSNKLLEFTKVRFQFKDWFEGEFAHYAHYFKINIKSEAFFTSYSFNKNFHKAFKFLNFWNYCSDFLMPIYKDLFSEFRFTVNQIQSDIKKLTTLNLTTKSVTVNVPAPLQLSLF